MDASLLVFAKVPRPGGVKTRLTPVLTPAEAAELYRAFLYDALDLYAQLKVDVRLYLAPPLPEGAVDDRPASVSVHPQEGEGLGARMSDAFRETFEAGFTRISVVGTDHPTLPAAYVRQSFRALTSDRSICIGPSEDGGFYLLGMSAYYPQLFEGMTYSHGDVFTDTLARVGTTDARLTVLPPWYDVDTPKALARMITDLEDSDVAAPRTRRAVDRLALADLLEGEGER